MRLFIFLLLISSITLSAQQPDVKLYYEQEGDSFIYYADNLELATVTIVFFADLTHMKSSSGIEFNSVLKGGSKKNKITELTPSGNNEKVSFRFKTRVVFGDLNQKSFKDHVYDLPFDKGQAYKLFQGYNGKATHRGENALDFSLKNGDQVHAARGGRVVKVIDSNSRSCMQPDCIKYNNLIIIEHEDGSFAEYVHIQKGGSKVNAGDVVETGQLIALSGKVGYASGPHLHFSVFIPDKDGRKTIKTKFKIEDGSLNEFPKEGETYTKNY